MIAELFLWSILSVDTLAKPMDVSENEFIPSSIVTEKTYTETNGLQEQITYFTKNKIQIQNATLTQLRNIPFLNTIDANKIRTYFKTNSFITKEILQSLIGNDMVDKIFSMIDISSQNEKEPRLFQDIIKHKVIENSSLEYINTMNATLPLQDGYTKNRYVGNPLKFQNKLLANISENIFISFVTDKDNGEAYWLDFYSASIQVSNVYYLKTFIVGDYGLRFGRGLLSRTNSFLYKSVENLFDEYSNGREVKYYSSTRESNFYRGVVGEIEIDAIRVIGFYSDTFRDATITNGVFTAFSDNNYHRTATELAKKDNLNEKNIGGRICFEYGWGEWNIFLAGTVMQTIFSSIYNKNTNFFQTALFYGHIVTNVSAECDVHWKNMNLYFEIASSLENRGVAVIGGVCSELAKSFFAEIMIRYYAPEYFSPRANAFSENGQVSNEAGVNFSVEAKGLSWLKIKSFIDFYYSIDSTYSSYLSLKGYDIQLKTTFTILPKMDFALTMQLRELEATTKQTDILNNQVTKIENTRYVLARSEFIYQITSQFSSKTKIDCKFYPDNLQYGWLFYQQCEFSISEIKCKLLGRISLFQTNGSAVSMYEYQHRVVYMSTILNNYGAGYRVLLNVSQEIAEHITISLSYAYFSKEGVTELGSGDDVIPFSYSHSIWTSIRVLF